jgi:inorganic phosphate transporter, PiT family
MDQHLIAIVLIVGFAILFDFCNGLNDAANAIATVVNTRVMSPSVAVAFGAILNFAGALFSSEVATTVGSKIADPMMITPATHLAAVMAAPLWMVFCARRGLPISCSHSLMGALIGSVLISAGTVALRGDGLWMIVAGVFTAPISGFIAGYLMLVAVAWIGFRMRNRTAQAIFSKLQIVSAGGMAFAHGTGDAQKAMGIITSALIAGQFIAHEPGKFEIPLWVRLSCAIAMGLGTAFGGWAVIRTLGSRLAHLRPHQGFAAETAGALTILVCTHNGIPISTTHSITGAILGVGSANGFRTVRWGVGKKIVFAWVCTFPVCILAGALMHEILQLCGVK